MITFELQQLTENSGNIVCQSISIAFQLSKSLSKLEGINCKATGIKPVLLQYTGHNVTEEELDNAIKESLPDYEYKIKIANNDGEA